MGKRRDDSICVSHGSPSGVGTRVPLERARTRCDPLPETLLRGHSGTSRTGPCYSSCGTSAARLRHVCGTSAARLRHVCGTTRGGPMDASNAGQGDQQLQRRGAATRRDEGGLDHRRRQRGPPTGFGLQGSRRRAQAIAALSPRRRGLLNVGPDDSSASCGSVSTLSPQRPAPSSFNVLTLPDFDRADRIGSYWARRAGP